MIEKENYYNSRTLRELENLLIYYKSSWRDTEKCISLIEKAIASKIKNEPT